MNKGNLLRVDQSQPIDWSHGFSQDLQAFWCGIPSRVGGTKLCDLTEYGRHGSLINMDPKTDWVQDTAVPYQGLDFDGSDDRVETGYTRDFPDQFSFFLLHYATPEDAFFTKSKGDGVYKNSPLVFEKGYSSYNQYNFYLNRHNGGSAEGFIGSNFELDGSLTLAVGTVDLGGEMRLYVDGVLDSSGTAPTSLSTTQSPITLANRANGGYASSTTIFSSGVAHRVWSADEVSWITEQSYHGFPDLLNFRGIS